MSDTYFCYCGTETYLKKDGNPWKHKTPLGTYCFGSSDPEVDLTDVKETSFLFEMSVHPDPELLEDEEWQIANMELAGVRAIEAGKSPVGEARLKEQVPEGRKVRLVYEVPVKEV